MSIEKQSEKKSVDSNLSKISSIKQSSDSNIQFESIETPKTITILKNDSGGVGSKSVIPEPTIPPPLPVSLPSKKSIQNNNTKQNQNQNNSNKTNDTNKNNEHSTDANRSRKGKFCSCDSWNFTQLRKYIIQNQARNCPKCKHKFQKIILIEKTMTVGDLICSLQGVMVIVIYLIQYSILYYIAFLALADVNISSVTNMDHTRSILLSLTVVFILATIYSMLNAIYTTARELCNQIDDKVIVDVLCDLSSHAAAAAATSANP